MAYVATYQREEPRREEVDQWNGLVMLEFGTDWCPICQAAQADIESALAAHPDVRHVKIEDGKGRPLGRSFRVKLWPTLVFLRDGAVVQQLARPGKPEIVQALREVVAR
jgi:thioredoxin 1